MPGSRNGYFQQHKLEQWKKGEEVKTLEIKKKSFSTEFLKIWSIPFMYDDGYFYSFNPNF